MITTPNLRQRRLKKARRAIMNLIDDVMPTMENVDLRTIAKTFIQPEIIDRLFGIWKKLNIDEKAATVITAIMILDERAHPDQEVWLDEIYGIPLAILVKKDIRIANNNGKEYDGALSMPFIYNKLDEPNPILRESNEAGFAVALLMSYLMIKKTFD